MKIMISSNLRTLRNAHRYSQEDVAEKIGVTRQSVAKWESGESLPDILKCQELAALFGITLDALVNGAIDNIISQPSSDGKHIFGIVTVGERGQIVIPKKARKVFQIEQGDRLLIVGDEKQGIGIVKIDGLKSLFDLGKNRKEEIDDED